MGNINIIYVDYLDSYLDTLNLRIPKVIKKILYKILNIVGYIKISGNIFILMCLEEDINNKLIRNLVKKLKANNAKNIVLANKFLENKELVETIRKDFNVLDGRWLYKFLIFDIIQKIAYIQNKKSSEYEITMLCDNPTEIVFENIEVISKNCKILNILTDNVEKFKYIEKKLYDKHGLLLNVSTNVEKVCFFSDIIVNIDFDEQRLERCYLKENSILIQCTKEKIEKNLKVVIIFFSLSFNKMHLSFFKRKDHFKEEILYESLLYYSISLDRMKNFFVRDNVKIRNFEGMHGKINFNNIKALDKF